MRRLHYPVIRTFPVVWCGQTSPEEIDSTVQCSATYSNNRPGHVIIQSSAPCQPLSLSLSLLSLSFSTFQLFSLYHALFFSSIRYKLILMSMGPASQQIYTSSLLCWPARITGSSEPCKTRRKLLRRAFRHPHNPLLGL